MLGIVAPSLSGGGSTVERTQPQRDTDTSTVSVMTIRAQAARRPDTAVRTNNFERSSTRTVDATEATPQARLVPRRTRQLNKPFSSDALDFVQRRQAVIHFDKVQRRQAVIRFVQDAIAASAARQKLNADNAGRSNTNEFKRGSLVLLATQNLPRHAVSEQASLLRASLGHSLCKRGMSPTAGDSQPRTRRRASSASRAKSRSRPSRSRSSAKPQQAEPYTTEAPASAARTETPAAARQLPVQPQDHSQQAADYMRGVFPPPPPPLRGARGAMR
ncbi:unnamed protein product [Phytophthora lilii]|uniref:Unnamed protein product n=1 Tax=Phytophthora lilii TaxID=2077276 RepID=A0A9W6TBB1_9STRA|nr:unnamed protein product [Phytophthora lilii]